MAVLVRLCSFLVLWLLLLAVAESAPTTAKSQSSNLLASLLSTVGSLTSAPPPQQLQSPNPSPECAAINQGETQCCRGSLAGDQPLVVFLAKAFGYTLNPNDVNGIICDNQVDQCPGVKLCCQVTALSPLLSLYCQDL